METSEKQLARRKELTRRVNLLKKQMRRMLPSPELEALNTELRKLLGMRANANRKETPRETFRRMME